VSYFVPVVAEITPQVLPEINHQTGFAIVVHFSQSCKTGSNRSTSARGKLDKTGFIQRQTEPLG
jgi:hypothetical protein